MRSTSRSPRPNLQKTMLLDQLERQTYEDCADRARQPAPARPAPGRRVRARAAPRPPARGGDGRPRPLQGGQRPLLARGRRRRAARDREDPDRAGAPHRPRRALRRRGVRDRAGRDRCGGRRSGCARSCAPASPRTTGPRSTRACRSPSASACADTTLCRRTTMLALADRNLYRAKAAGRNRSRGKNVRLKPDPQRQHAGQPTLHLADQPHHHAEDLERALGTDRRVGLVLGAQDELAASTSRRFSVNWLSTIATTMSPFLRRRPLLDDDEVAVEDAGVDHRVALDADQHRRRRALDQVVVDGQRFGVACRRSRSGRPARTGASASGRAKKRRVGASRRSGVDSR